MKKSLSEMLVQLTSEDRKKDVRICRSCGYWLGARERMRDGRCEDCSETETYLEAQILDYELDVDTWEPLTPAATGGYYG